MTALKYGYHSGPRPAVRQVHFAASQIFREDGGGFVTISSGNAILSLTASTGIFGYWCEGFSPNSPEVTTSYGASYFTTSATAGTKYSVAIANESTEFLVPTDAAYARASHIGKDCDLIGVNDGTVQTANIDTSSTNVLRIVGGEEGVSEAIVLVHTPQIA